MIRIIQKIEKLILSHFKGLERQVWALAPLATNNAILSHFCALLGAVLVLLGIGGCGTTKKVLGGQERAVVYIDSLIVRDSVVIVPVEKIMEIAVPPDTLFLETSMASASAWYCPEINLLKGKIENKNEKLKQLHFETRVVIERDTTIIKIPVIQEKIIEKVPKWSWYTLGFCIIFVLVFIIKIYLKFKI